MTAVGRHRRVIGAQERRWSKLLRGRLPSVPWGGVALA